VFATLIILIENSAVTMQALNTFIFILLLRAHIVISLVKGDITAIFNYKCAREERDKQNIIQPQDHITSVK
jgi:hypothetical protein